MSNSNRNNTYYRIWYRPMEKMYYVPGYRIEGEEHIWRIIFYCDYSEVKIEYKNPDDVVIMNNLPLKDKYGNVIFEGDKIRLPDNEIIAEGRIVVVDFSRGEICGNIYDKEVKK